MGSRDPSFLFLLIQDACGHTGREAKAMHVLMLHYSFPNMIFRAGFQQESVFSLCSIFTHELRMTAIRRIQEHKVISHPQI